MRMSYRLKHQRITGSAIASIRNISSTGAFFTAGACLAIGDRVVLMIEWPSFLDGEVPLNLVAQGEVVRSDGGGTAVRFLRHEFRTRRKAGARV